MVLMTSAGMAESEYAMDLKSIDRNIIRVQISLPALHLENIFLEQEYKNCRWSLNRFASTVCNRN